MEREYNAFHDYIDAPLILTKPNGDRIGEQSVIEKTQTRKFVEYDEQSFTTYQMMDHKKNPYYDDILELMFIEIPTIGRFVITEIDINSEDEYNESKSCTALSAEVQLAQKYLELFTINMGTTESLDGIQLYSESDTSHSLLHLVLEKCPDWTISHVSADQRTVQRSFEVSREDVYSFLTGEMSEAFEAIVQFDTINHEIKVYKETEIGEDINVALSYNNLLQSTDISSSTDDIKTCLTVTGDNELNLREVNLGYDRIYNIEYFHDLAYMSQGLYDAYTRWKLIWDQALIDYRPLTLQRHELVKQKNYLTSEMLPENPPDPEEGLTDEDWSEYSLNGLKEKKAANEQALAVSMKAGYGDPGDPEGTAEERRKHQMYIEQYLPVYNRIQDIDAEIVVRQGQIDAVQAQIDQVDTQMNAVVQRASIPNNFTEAQQHELSKFIREDELSSSNYIVTDTMTEDERYEMLQDMLQYGREELAKVAQPTLDFSVDMANIYLIPEFDGLSNKFEPGNYLYVYLRDDYYVKARILTIEEDMVNPENFKVTFGNLMKTKVGKVLQDITKALKQATSAATSVSFGQSYWNEANKEATAISKQLADGLVAAGETIKTASSDVQIDDRGIWVNNTTDETGIFLGGGQILFTDDRFETIQTALGKCTYTDGQGVSHTDFGLLAQFVIAGYIAGSTIEGTNINNGNGTFSVDEDGNLTATSAEITGEITATSGKIADYTIAGAKLVGNNVGLSGTSGDGWAFWAGAASPGTNAPFRVGHDGHLYATNATISGAISSSTITSTSIDNGNGTFSVDSNGNLTATKANITGTLTSGNGTIGGWKINSTTQSGTNSFTLGTYTQSDVTAAQNAQIGLSDYETAQAKYDVDGSGSLDVRDVAYIRMRVNGTTVTQNNAVTQDASNKYPQTISQTGSGAGLTQIGAGGIVTNNGYFTRTMTVANNGMRTIDSEGHLQLGYTINSGGFNFVNGLLVGGSAQSPRKGGNAASGYIRFPSINMQIAWKRVTWTGTISAGWGNIFDNGVAIDMGYWAASFSEEPRVVRGATTDAGSAGVMVEYYGKPTSTAVGSVCLARGSSMTQQTWIIYMIGIGAYE